jgi:hypothetical protein
LKTSSTNLILLIFVIYLSIIFLVVIPETVSLLETKSDELLVLKNFHSQDTDQGVTKVLGIEFDWSITLIDVVSKIVGAILSFLGILWSIYVWNHNRKKT